MSPLIAQNPHPRVILGLMTFGPEGTEGARISDNAEFGKVLDIMQSRGYNEVDTARVYCDKKQEAFTREVGWKDRGLTLATKIEYPSKPGMNSHDKVLASFAESLEELGTDSVDILYLHAADRATPFAETLSAIDQLHREGKFAKFGLSNFTAFEVAEVVMTCKANGWVRPSIYEGMYNVLTRGIEGELIPACRRYGLDVVVYNPIAGGLFSGKIKTKDMIPESGRYGGNTAQSQLYRKRYFRDSTFNAMKLIEPAVEKAGITMIETALRWTVHHSALKVTDGNDGVIIGVSSKEQLDDNLTHLEKGPLPEDLVKVLDDAWTVSKADGSNYWHLDLEYGYDTREALFAPGAK